uniref:wiskott-Aldrich syndrome protein homolog 1-like n=1 Tax=Podarcis muralis TaxID=64176 RepID=UPI00109F2CF6|nr:wiskott-Aldrich syndrome protein homolog 1-like [Podarcis muralis]
MAEGEPTLSLPGQGGLWAQENLWGGGGRGREAPLLSQAAPCLFPPPEAGSISGLHRGPPPGLGGRDPLWLPWLSPSPTLLTHRGRGSPSLLLTQPLPSQPPGLQIENHLLLSPQTQVTPRYDAPPAAISPPAVGRRKEGGHVPMEPPRQRRPVLFPSQHREGLLCRCSSRGKSIPKGTGSVAAEMRRKFPGKGRRGVSGEPPPSPFYCRQGKRTNLEPGRRRTKRNPWGRGAPGWVPFGLGNGERESMEGRRASTETPPLPAPLTPPPSPSLPAEGVGCPRSSVFTTTYLHTLICPEYHQL